MKKQNDRLKRIQVNREQDVPLDNSGLWFLIIKENGDWDAENNLDVFLEDIKLGKIKYVFCVWHGQWRTNLFLMKRQFILNNFKNHTNHDRNKQKTKSKTS